MPLLPALLRPGEWQEMSFWLLIQVLFSVSVGIAYNQVKVNKIAFLSAVFRDARKKHHRITVLLFV